MQPARRRLVGVVDDDAAVRDSLRLLLQTSGYRVVSYPSAEHFLAGMADQAFDCLLIDQHMPVVTGLELLESFARLAIRPPIALMTGSPSPQLTRRALALGAVAVLEKPLAEDALFRFLEDAAP